MNVPLREFLRLNQFYGQEKKGSENQGSTTRQNRKTKEQKKTSTGRKVEQE